MAKGTKSGGKNREPGQSGNPSGRPKVQGIKKIRDLTLEEVKEITSLILGQDFDSINQIYENKDHEQVLLLQLQSRQFQEVMSLHLILF